MLSVGSRWKALLIASLLVSAHALGEVRTREQINRETEARLRKDVTFLASAECEGRGPNTQGLDKAADYIAAEFKRLGLKPGLGTSYFQPFYIAGAVGSLTLVGPDGKSHELKQLVDFIPLGIDQKGKVTAPVVFVGYGIRCKEPAYDDYAGLNVGGKIVVLIRDTPRAADPNRSKEMAAAASFVAKLTQAKKEGALAVLVVNDAEAAGLKDDVAGANTDGLIDFSYSALFRGGPARLPAMMLKRHWLERMLPQGQKLLDIEKQIDRDLKPASRELTGWTARLEVERKADAIPVKNVVGVLEGNGPLAQQTVVIGAHYDHLGYGGPNSLANNRKRAIHYGADDNASGTSAMLELARRFAAIPDRQGRRLVFIAFSSEELGLFGSRHYCEKPLFPLTETAAMLNLDMVGRLRKDPKSDQYRVLTEGHGTAKPFKELLDAQAKKHGFTLTSQASGFGPSDHASFTAKKVPVLFFWTGTHPEYHRPTDTADTINYEGMRRIVDMAEEVAVEFTRMEKPAFVEVPGTRTGRPSKGPRLGIRPGYAEGVEGLLIEGVAEGTPAAKAGLKEGDRIIRIATKPIKDIGTYMEAMAAQKAGSTIDITILRDKKEVVLKVKLD
jgi:hypothetical protein